MGIYRNQMMSVPNRRKTGHAEDTDPPRPCGGAHNERGEPDFGTVSARLWLLRSRPDQFHRRTMRRGPPTDKFTTNTQSTHRRAENTMPPARAARPVR